MQYNAASAHKNYFTLTVLWEIWEGLNKYSSAMVTASTRAKGRQTRFRQPDFTSQHGDIVKVYNCQSCGWNAWNMVVVEMPNKRWKVWGSYLETLYTRRWRLSTKFVRGWMLHQPDVRQSNTEGGFTCTRATDIKKEWRDSWRLFQ